MLLLVMPLSTEASVAVSNSVSVSSSGDGVSTMHVKTISNGEVVENTSISTTTPFHYHSSYTTEDGLKTSLQTSDIEKLETIKKLLALLNELQTLMALYEKIYAK